MACVIQQTKLLVIYETVNCGQNGVDLSKSFACSGQYFMHQSSTGLTILPQQCPLSPTTMEVTYHFKATFKPRK